MAKINDDVLLDMQECIKIGITIPKKAIDMAKNNDLSEFSVMKITEITSLLCDLAYIH